MDIGAILHRERLAVFQDQCVCVISGLQRLTPSVRWGSLPIPTATSCPRVRLISTSLVFGVKTSGCGPSRDVSICSTQSWFQ